MLELNRIYNMDCIEGLKLLDNDTIDLIITSPPYNVDLGNNKINKNKYDVYNDNIEFSKYIKWLEEIFQVAYSKLRSGGRVCINIGDKQNGRIPTHSYIINFMEKIGYLTYTTIIWDKNQVGNRTAWGSFKSPSNPSFPTPFEYILVFAKNSYKLNKQGETDLTKEEFIKWSCPLWKFNPETSMSKYNHPAMFPQELPKRCIKMFSYVGDTVVDIFSGVGTTCVEAKLLNRNYIGFEISKNYFDISNKRLEQTFLKNELF